MPPVYIQTIKWKHLEFMGEQANNKSRQQEALAMIDALAARGRVEAAAVAFVLDLTTQEPPKDAPSSHFVDDETFRRLIGK